MVMDNEIPQPKKRHAFPKNLDALSALVRVADPSNIERMIAATNERDMVFDRSVDVMLDLARKWRDDPSSIPSDEVEGKLTASDLTIIADKMAALAGQVDGAAEGTIWSGLMIAEDLGSGFLAQLDLVLKYTHPPTEEEVAAHKMRQESRKEVEALIEAPHEWPPIAEEEFVLTVDVPSGPAPDHRPYLVLRVGDQEIYRKPTFYGHYGHLGTVCRQMVDAYSGRIRDVVFAPGAKENLTWDDWSGDAGIRKALRPLRKNIERTQRQKREAEKEQERQDSDPGSVGNDRGDR